MWCFCFSFAWIRLYYDYNMFFCFFFNFKAKQKKLLEVRLHWVAFIINIHSHCCFSKKKHKVSEKSILQNYEAFFSPHTFTRYCNHFVAVQNFMQMILELQIQNTHLGFSRTQLVAIYSEWNITHWNWMNANHYAKLNHFKGFVKPTHTQAFCY